MKKHEAVFHSLLAESILDFLAHKRALKRRYTTEEAALRLLDRYLFEKEVTDIALITPDLIEAFLASRRRGQPRSYNHLLGVLRRLFDWLVIQERIRRTPVLVRPRRSTAQRTPFLFDSTQARQLLDFAAALPESWRAHGRGETYAMIFALLYGLGLRIGEASRLCRRDVDLDRQILAIRETKFSKSRLVPFGPRMDQRLRKYIRHSEQRRGTLQSDSPVFSFNGEQPISSGSINRTFHRLLFQLNLDLPAGVRSPSPHSLRHSFAVATLLRWYRTGKDPGKRLIRLSTFLGHVNPMSTAVYLTITADLLKEAGDRFERFAAPVGGEE
jgi:integrase